MASVLSAPYFHDEAAAFEALEGLVWPKGPTCPLCGAVDRINRLVGVRTKPSKKNPEGIERHGLHKCYHCRGQFTVRKGTVFEDSAVPLCLWFQAAHLLCSSKKGISANQLHRTLGVTLKTAWFMGHRLREAMRLGQMPPLGGKGKVVEADETFIGRKEGTTPSRGTQHKRAVLSLVERGGSVRSFHIDKANLATIGSIVVANVARESALMTDEARHYRKVGKRFARHEAVNHSAEEYVRGDAYTNTLEGYYSIFKRGFKGIYQHCAEKHLHRYLAEYDFRYNNRTAVGAEDGERATRALKGIVGKRLTYKSADRAVASGA